MALVPDANTLSWGILVFTLLVLLFDGFLYLEGKQTITQLTVHRAKTNTGWSAGISFFFGALLGHLFL